METVFKILVSLFICWILGTDEPFTWPTPEEKADFIESAKSNSILAYEFLKQTYEYAKQSYITNLKGNQEYKEGLWGIFYWCLISLYFYDFFDLSWRVKPSDKKWLELQNEIRSIRRPDLPTLLSDPVYPTHPAVYFGVVVMVGSFLILWYW